MSSTTGFYPIYYFDLRAILVKLQLRCNLCFSITVKCIFGIDIYKAIAYAEAKAGNITAARTAIKKAFKAAWSENRFVTATVIEARVVIENMFDINIMTANQISCSGHQCYAVAKALSQEPKTNLNELLKWVEALKGRYHNRVYAYLGVADGLSERNINTNK